METFVNTPKMCSKILTYSQVMAQNLLNLLPMFISLLFQRALLNARLCPSDISLAHHKTPIQGGGGV